MPPAQPSGSAPPHLEDSSIVIERHPTLRNTWRLRSEIILPGTPEDIFPFFADARNLEAITPDFLKFQVVTPAPIDMYEGALIDYKLRVRGLPLRWRTRITQWNPPFSFQDDQVKGPYSLWCHTHTFEHVEEGTRASDVVEYRVPGGGLIGGLVHSLLVKRDVRNIFEHRTAKLRQIFRP